MNHRRITTGAIVIIALGCLSAYNIYFENKIVDSLIPLQEIGSTNKSSVVHREGPFDMPRNGSAYDIFQPLYDMDESKKDKPIMVSPSEMIKTFENRISWVDTMVHKDQGFKEMTQKDHAKLMYLETIKEFVSGVVYNDAELSVYPVLRRKPNTAALNKASRNEGNDWTYAGDTMTGTKRLNNVYNLLKDVTSNGIEGDYIETGVWRGGSSVYAKAILTVLEIDQEPDVPRRVSYVCDSFKGLPPGDRSLDKEDQKWDSTPYLEVPAEIVANNFIKYGLLDSNVVFARGFFNETMPPLSTVIKSLSVMRLDGDMYESTVDVLYNLYDKLSIGGYVIMDDWTGFPSKTACEDFFAVHGINPEIIKIDRLSAYWKKTEHVDIQKWRYEQLKFKPEQKKLPSE